MSTLPSLKDDAIRFNFYNHFGSEAPHKHDYLETILLVEGCCQLELQGKSILLQRKQFIFVPMGIEHILNNVNVEPSAIVTIHIPAEALDPISRLLGSENPLSLILVSQPTPYTLTEKVFVDLLPEIRRLRQQDNPIHTMKIILNLFEEIGKPVSIPAEFSAVEQILGKALLAMQTEENLAEGVPALVRLSGYSLSRLNTLMKTRLGLTPHKYVTNLRMTAAKESLLHTDNSVLAISLSLGYATESHFISVFKKHYGITPALMRKKG